MELDLGPAPSFSEPVEDVVDRVRALVGKVTVPRDFSRAHHAIQTLLMEDDKRRTAYLAARYPSSFDAPFYDSPFERRRLRVLNALAVALARQGCNPEISKKRIRRALDTRLARRHDGVIAWIRDADPAVGEFGPSEELYRAGEIPDLE